MQVVEHKLSKKLYALKYIEKAWCIDQNSATCIIQERLLLEKVHRCPSPGRFMLLDTSLDWPHIHCQSALCLSGWWILFLRPRSHAWRQPPVFVQVSNPSSLTQHFCSPPEKNWADSRKYCSLLGSRALMHTWLSSPSENHAQVHLLWWSAQADSPLVIRDIKLENTPQDMPTSPISMLPLTTPIVSCTLALLTVTPTWPPRYLGSKAILGK